MSAVCVFCCREGVKTREHHVVPRCKGGRETVPACQTCEDFIHQTWTHNELRDTYNTVESLRATDRFQAFLRWLLKQPKTAYYRSDRGKTRSPRKYS